MADTISATATGPKSAPEIRTTGAASSGIRIDKKDLKALMRRSDAIPLIWVAGLVACLLATGSLLYAALGSWWVVPATLLHGTVLTVGTYALSHECAHGTAFRTRWLNELVLWISSFFYFEEPYQRRYTHASHHSYTWIHGKDQQMPFARTPLSFWGWLEEVSCITLTWYEIKAFARNAVGDFSPAVRACTPESELAKIAWSARAYVLAYAGLAALCIFGPWSWPLYLIVIPRLVGGPIMGLVILMQHVEMAENQPDILRSTRSFRTNPLMRLIYLNMNYHIEHHLYPNVPFYRLPALNRRIQEQLPEPDPGFLRTNWEVLGLVLRRSLGLPDKAVRIRQAADMP